MVYSTEEDGEFIKDKVFKSIQHPNEPLASKWNRGVRELESIDFDAVIFLGSDDYIDEAFIEFAKEQTKEFDFIGFKDLYFEHNKELWWWCGYKGHREGEPSGAGKIYTKELLEKMDYDLFGESSNRSLDGVSWARTKKFKRKQLITTLRQNNLFCCDVKDGLGMTDIKNIPNVRKADHL